MNGANMAANSSDLQSYLLGMREADILWLEEFQTVNEDGCEDVDCWNTEISNSDL